MNLIEKLEGMRKFAVEHYNPMAASGAITVIDELISWHNKQSHIQVVGGPASASGSDGEQLGNEGSAKSVRDGVNGGQIGGLDAYQNILEP